MNGSDDTVVAAAPAPAENVKKPLSLFILLNQTFSKEQKQLVLHKLNSSLNQLNDPALSQSYIVNLQEELNYVIQANQHHESYSFDQEYRVASKNDKFEFDLLVNSTIGTFKKALQEFLQSPTQIKSFIYAGIDYNGSASLALQDSLFSYDDLHLILNDYIASAGEALKTTSFNFNFNSKHIHENASWKHLEKLLKNAKFLTPTVSEADDGVINDLTNFARQFLNEKLITDLMEETKLTGTLNVEKPALYIFPSREGDCSFFTFNGYSMLVNGGYDRVNPSFWRFASMLKQIDSVMVTHQDADATGGLSSLFAKKLAQPGVKPNVLSVFGNLVKSKSEHSDADVILNAADELKLKVQPLVKRTQAHVKPHQQPEHVNLYFKHGYGSFDMYVLSPFDNSAEYKEFLHHTQAKVQANTHKSHLNVNQTFKNIPIQHLCSAVVLLAWTPSKANENAVRILFTGDAPQHVIALALEKVKDFDLLQTPVYKIKDQTVAPVVVKKPVAKPAAAPAGDAATATAPVQNGSKPVSKPAEKPAGDRLNTSASASKPAATNGAAKPAAKPPSAAKPAAAANGVSNKRESTAPAAAKAETAKKPEKAEETKKPAPTASAKPPAPKKEETKAKAESTRVSTAPVTASKSEHNTKPTTATAAPVAAKPRPSSAKPNVKPEKAEEKKPVAAKPPAKPAAEQKSKPAAKPSKPAAATAAKPEAAAPVKEEPKVEVKVEQEQPPVAEACYVVETVVAVPEPVKLEPVEAAETVVSAEQVEAQVEQPQVEQPQVEEEVVLKQDIEQMLTSNGVTEDVTNGAVEEQEELSRKEEITENRNEFVPSDCVPMERPVDDEVIEKAEHYINQNAEEDAAAVLNDEEEADECCEDEDNQDESPNLSPVKPSVSRDSISSEDQVVLETEPTENEDESPRDDAVVLQEVEVEDDGVRREDLELNLDDVPPVQACVVASPHEFIKTPQHSSDNSPVVETAPTDDVMTRSFIDNGEEGQSNPFLAAEAPKESQTSSEETSNDDSVQEFIVDEEPVDVQQQQEATPVEPSSEFDSLINNFNQMNIEQPPQQEEEQQQQETTPEVTNGLSNGHHNGHHHEEENGHVDEEAQKTPKAPPTDLLLDFDSQPACEKVEKQQTPTTTTSAAADIDKWNLLELPKPVNPETAATTNGTSTAAAQNGTKPTTPNAKRAPPLSQSSPTASAPAAKNAEPTSKSSKGALNTSVSKPTAAATKPPQSGPKPAPSAPVHPLYFEVSYVPAHGNPYYVDSEFFKRVRARFYVLSTIDPSQHVLNSLLDAKQTWEDKELQVSIIPTYESDTLRHWFLLNAEQLAKNKIDVLPAANLTTLTIDNNTDFAYQVHKLEF